MRKTDTYMPDPILYLIAFLICFFLFAILLMAVSFIGSRSCTARWPDTEHSFSMYSGCLIKTKSGIYIPENNYIEIKQ